MKILHIIPSYLPATYASGPIKPTHYLNKALVKKGVEVFIYTMNMDEKRKLNVPLEKEVNLDGVKVYYFPMSFLPWQYSYRLHQALAKNIKNFDLIHITSVFLSVSTLGAYYAKKFKKPYIISPHGSLMAEPLKRRSLKKQIYIDFVEKINLKNASAVHFLTDREKEDYLKTSLPIKKSIVVPNSLDTKEFKEGSPTGFFREKFKIPRNKKIILFMGRLHWIKGLDTLISAFGDAVNDYPDSILVLAGQDDGYKEKAEKMIKDGNLKNSVIFTGPIWGKEKIAALSESNLFALASYSEDCPMVMIEAMHFGLPVIITKNNGLSPYVIKVNSGLVVEKNREQLRQAILKLLKNADLAAKMGEAGRELVKKEFSPELVAERFIKAYNKIITP